MFCSDLAPLIDSLAQLKLPEQAISQVCDFPSPFPWILSEIDIHRQRPVS